MTVKALCVAITLFGMGCGGGVSLDGMGLGWDGAVDIGVPSGECVNGRTRPIEDSWVDAHAEGPMVYECTDEPRVGVWHRGSTDIILSCMVHYVDGVVRAFRCPGYCRQAHPNNCLGLWIDDGGGPLDEW